MTSECINQLSDWCTKSPTKTINRIELLYSATRWNFIYTYSVVASFMIIFSYNFFSINCYQSLIRIFMIHIISNAGNGFFVLSPIPPLFQYLISNPFVNIRKLNTRWLRESVVTYVLHGTLMDVEISIHLSAISDPGTWCNTTNILPSCQSTDNIHVNFTIHNSHA